MTWLRFDYCQIRSRLLTAQECAALIALKADRNPIVSRLGTTRDSDIYWIPEAPATAVVFARLRELVAAYNQTYGFELDTAMGQLQLTGYRPGQHYDWHMDLGHGAISLRKLSVSVELSAEGSYDGGGLEIFYGERGDNRAALRQGDAVVFPSFVMHRACPVTRGQRWSLVAWLTGPQPLR